MSLRSYVPVPLCLRPYVCAFMSAPLCLSPYVCALMSAPLCLRLMSCALLSSPLCHRSVKQFTVERRMDLSKELWIPTSNFSPRSEFSKTTPNKDSKFLQTSTAFQPALLFENNDICKHRHVWLRLRCLKNESAKVSGRKRRSRQQPTIAGNSFLRCIVFNFR